jgi:hypothetical protein
MCEIIRKIIKNILLQYTVTTFQKSNIIVIMATGVFPCAYKASGEPSITGASPSGSFLNTASRVNECRHNKVNIARKYIFFMIEGLSWYFEIIAKLQVY